MALFMMVNLRGFRIKTSAHISAFIIPHILQYVFDSL